MKRIKMFITAKLGIIGVLLLTVGCLAMTPVTTLAAPVASAAPAATGVASANVKLSYGPAPAGAVNQILDGSTWVTCTKCGTTTMSPAGVLQLQLPPDETLVVATIVWQTPQGTYVKAPWDGSPMPTQNLANGYTFVLSLSYAQR